MIHKNAECGQLSDITLLEFGFGDIITSPVRPGDGDTTQYGGVIFTNSEPHPIGQDHPAQNGQTTDDIKPQVMMTFTKLSSFDVVIEMMQVARKEFAERLAAAAA